jgi:hypothetical protein
MRSLWLVSLAASMALGGGCVQQPPPPPMVWIRTDGISIKENPAFAQKFDVDKTVCEGEMQKANLSGTQICRGLADCIVQGQQRGSAVGIVGKGCMADRGYVLVPEDQAQSQMAAFRAASISQLAPPNSKAKR